MKQIVICIFIGFIFNSCAVMNMTAKDEHNKICSLHEKSMKKFIVRVQYGRFCSDRNSIDFPNAKCIKCMGCVIRGTLYRYAVTWTCSTCTKIKRKAKREQL